MVAFSPTSSDKTAALLMHLSGIFLGPIVSAILYFAAAANNPWLKEQARNAFNFQLTLLIAWVVVSVLHWVLFWLYGPLELINIIFSVIGAIKANAGESWRYPAAIEFLKGQ
jgi:uncharacterized protein